MARGLLPAVRHPAHALHRMASAASAEPDAVSASAAKPASRKAGIAAMLIPVVLSVAASGGVSFFMARKAAAPAGEGHGTAGEHGGDASGGEHGGGGHGAVAAANYVPLEPAFVVNL